MNTIKIILTFISAFLLAANAAATSDCMDKYTDLTAYGPWKNKPECKISLSEAIESPDCRFSSNDKNDGYELDLTDLSLTTIDDIQDMLMCLEDTFNFSSVDISNNFINCETLYDGAKDDEGSSDDYAFELTCNSFLQCGALNKEECYKHSSVCFFEDYQCKTLNATVPNPKVVLSLHSAITDNPTDEEKAEVEASIRNVITSYLKGIGVEASAVRITIEWVVVLDTKRRDEDNQFIPVVTITFIVEDESRLQSAQNSATSLAKAAAEGTLSKDKEFKEVSVTLIKDNEKERPAQPVNNGKTELGGGAIAGVVVACVILAIIIIVEIAFLVYNSRNQKRPRSVDEPENVIYISDSDSEIDQSSDSSSSESESDDDEESKEEEEESSSYNDSVGDFSSSEDEKKEEPLKKEEESESESDSESESESESDSDSESESDSESTDSSSASSSSE